MQENPEIRDYAGLIWRSRRLIGWLVLIALMAALAVSLLAPRTYESEGLLEIGKVWETGLESAYVITEVLNSDSLLLKVAQASGLQESLPSLRRRSVLNAETLEAGPQRQPFLIRVRGRGRTAEESRKVVEGATRLIIERHEPRFQSLLEQHRRFEQELEKQIGEVRAELGELERLLINRRGNPGVEAPAVILMQSQLEEKQTQLLEFQKELRDVRVKNYSPVYTKNTELAVEAVTPQRPVSPNLLLNLALAGLGSLALAIAAVFTLNYFRPS